MRGLLPPIKVLYLKKMDTRSTKIQVISEQFEFWRFQSTFFALSIILEFEWEKKYLKFKISYLSASK